MAQKKTFRRTTSGLARGFGPITAMFIAIAFAVGAGWVGLASVGLSPLPENLWYAGIPPIVMSFALGGIIVLILMLGYSILISAMPRSGGGYVMISRIVNPFAAFIGSWFEFFAIAIFLGIFATLIMEFSFYSIGPGLGIIPFRAAYDDVGFFVGAVGLIVVFTTIVALGVRITGYAMQALVWVPAALSLYVFYLLGVAIVNPATLQSGISMWAQGHGVSGVSADTYVQAALTQGLDAANVGDYWTAVSAAMLGVYLSYTGFAATTFVAGEVKDPQRNFPRILLVATLIITLMFISMASFGTYAAAAVGRTTLPNGHTWSFLEAWSYLSFRGELSQAGLPPFRARIPFIASMVALGSGLGPLNFLLLAFFILWIVNDLPAMILVCSRIIFAMSLDGVLPSSLSRVNGRFNSPIYAIMLTGIFAVLGALSETCVVCTGASWGVGGAVGEVLNSLFSNGLFALDFLDIVFFTLFSLAVVLFPFRLKKIYDAAPFRPGGKLGVAAIGLAGLIANLVIGLVILVSPQDSYNVLSPTPDNWFALEFTAFLGIIGALIYAYYRYGPSRKELDYSTIFSEIPPE